MSDNLRFGFGENWQHYLSHLDQRKLEAHRSSLTARFGMQGLSGKRFLDAGSGSGVFSRAAASLGACVTSFDYDPASVACTQAMREQPHLQLHGTFSKVAFSTRDSLALLTHSISCTAGALPITPATCGARYKISYRAAGETWSSPSTTNKDDRAGAGRP